jgi:hypothetical protein
MGFLILRDKSCPPCTFWWQIALMERQKLSQRLYESRIASLQRCVSFFVMFHHMAGKVQRFWPKVR